METFQHSREWKSDLGTDFKSEPSLHRSLLANKGSANRRASSSPSSSSSSTTGSSFNKFGRTLYGLEMLPRLDETDTIELYHLRSFRKEFVKSGDEGNFALQTSGLALRSTTTQGVIVLEYVNMYGLCCMFRGLNLYSIAFHIKWCIPLFYCVPH